LQGLFDPEIGSNRISIFTSSLHLYPIGC